MARSPVPTFNRLLKPTIRALVALGGSASNQEIDEWVIDHMKLPEQIRTLTHGNSGITEIQYRLRWARTYLKKARAVDNSERGIWTVTEAGRVLTDSEIEDIPRRVRTDHRRARTVTEPIEDAPSLPALEQDWTDSLAEALGRMQPAAFERLCQRILRESGFTRVEVTGKTGDGGIDGIGVLRVNLVSFHVLFQCKRWKGSVGAGVVRDFRGAMVGRADKGLIITTGSFTADANREATRDGAPAIDLVDGEALARLLKELGLGVVVKLVEEISVEESFFQTI